MRAGTAWLMWSIPAALFLVAFFHRNAPGVMARDLMETFGVTGAVIGLLSSTYFYSYAGFMIPGGLLIDAFGARRVVAAGGAVMGLGTLAMGAAGLSAPLAAGPRPARRRNDPPALRPASSAPASLSGLGASAVSARPAAGGGHTGASCC